jgi:hypothetical protein
MKSTRSPKSHDLRRKIAILFLSGTNLLKVVEGRVKIGAFR